MAAASRDVSELDKVLNKLGEDFLACALCLEQFKTPKILPCIHSFCEPCLTALVKKEGKLKCPTCGMLCKLSEGGVAQLKANFFINSLVELYNKQRPTDDDKKPAVCNGCEVNEGTHWCIDCGTHLCTFCYKSHTRFLPGHKVMTLEGYQEAISSNLLLQQKIYCNSHPDNLVRLYCETCKVVVCTDCAIIKHRSMEHIHRDLQEAADEYAKQLMDLASQMRDTEKAVERCESAAKLNKEKLAAKCQKEEVKVKKRTAEVIQSAQREEKRLIEKLKEEYAQRLKREDVEIDDWEMKHGNISSLCDYLEALVHHGTAAQMMSIKQDIVDHVKLLISMKTDVTYETDLPEFYSAKQYVEIGSIRLPTKIGKLEEPLLTELITYDENSMEIEKTMYTCQSGIFQIRSLPQETGNSSLGKENMPIRDSVSEYAGKRLIKVIGGRGDGEGQFNFPTGVSTNRHGDIVTADTGNNRVQITDRDGNCKLNFTFTEFDKPFRPRDVAVLADDKYIMTDRDNQQVVVSDENGSLLGCFGKEVKNPMGVAVSPVDGSVYVSDWDGWTSASSNKKGHCIKKYTAEFQYVKSFGSYGRKQGKFNGPYYLAINKSGTLFVSDTNNYRIQAFTAEGEFMYEFGDFGQGEGKLYWPTGVVLDEAGYLYVSDQKNRNVQKFDALGNFVCRIDRPEDALDQPLDLAVMDDMRVVVADFSNHCLKVFKNECE